jgi:hypothetical protein
MKDHRKCLVRLASKALYVRKKCLLLLSQKLIAVNCRELLLFKKFLYKGTIGTVCLGKDSISNSRRYRKHLY